MKRLVVSGTYVVLGCLFALYGAHAVSAGPAATEASAECVSSRAEARPRGYGYQHVVVLESRCSAAMTCTVTTDASPQPIDQAVSPGAKVEVATFLSSPASRFTATVRCRARK